ncbi:serine hydrolase [Phytoactinopolyspora sp. XMNu-373]|uniref:Serine hydrolase n=1 Tax=Phytoactinopolyspora mesophila TaxID=2650750 RepID=A0A7K3M8Y1_9ACTN|nr:serine hydrolase [Phytoactinopolyspora mesophila]
MPPTRQRSPACGSRESGSPRRDSGDSHGSSWPTLSCATATNTTGEELIRAGTPEGWTIGDRTGAGGYGTRNAIAVRWPPEREPIVLAVMSTRETDGAESGNSLIADATEVALDALSQD